MKNLQKCDTKLIEEAIDKMGITVKQFAEEIGVQSNTVRGWISKGEAPKSALLCVEALQRRTEKEPETDAFLLIRTARAHLDAFHGLADGVSATVTDLEV